MKVTKGNFKFHNSEFRSILLIFVQKIESDLLNITKSKISRLLNFIDRIYNYLSKDSHPPNFETDENIDYTALNFKNKDWIIGIDIIEELF